MRRPHWKWLLPVALVVIGIVTAIMMYRPSDGWSLTPARSFGSPLRAGERVYLLTGQWRTRIALMDEGPLPTELFVDLWAFDAVTAKPQWRRRVQAERNGAMAGRSILGAQGNTLWLLLPRGLLAVSLSDGTTEADGDRIESQNPQLKGLLPKDSRYFQFDALGLKITAADGREWRLDPATFQARKVETDTFQARQDISHAAYFTPNHTSSFQKRGLHMPGHWLGLLTDQEMEKFHPETANEGVSGEVRRRLWHAKTGEAKNFFGKYTTYSEFKPLGGEFLMPGLLTIRDSGGEQRVLWIRDPDSVFLLHRDRLGEEGRWRLARVAGPEGRLLWDVGLPLSVLQSAMQSEKTVVLYGVEYRPRRNDQPRDPMHDAREKLIAIDLATGKLGAYDQSDVAQHIKALVPAEKQ
jgi:hypothetical protein